MVALWAIISLGFVFQSGADSSKQEPPGRPFGPIPFQSTTALSIIFYRPVSERAVGLRRGELAVQTGFTYGAISDSGTNSNLNVVFDGEFLRWDTRLRYGLSDRVSVAATVPFHYTTGGFLDSFIDSFHSLAGGGRDSDLEEDEFTQEIVVGGETLFDMPNNTFALGDIALELKWVLMSEADFPVTLALRAGIEFPTGDADRSLGNGNMDGAFGLLVERTFGDFTFFLNADLLIEGNVRGLESAGLDEENFLLSASFAVEWRPWDWFGLGLQFDYRSSPFSGTGLVHMDDDEIIVSLNFSYRLGRDVQLQVGVIEDLGSVGPDLAFTLSLEMTLLRNKEGRP